MSEAERHQNSLGSLFPAGVKSPSIKKAAVSLKKLLFKTKVLKVFCQEAEIIPATCKPPSDSYTTQPSLNLKDLYVGALLKSFFFFK